MNVLSIQSAVALGHVGNSGAAFVLRRLGHDVWPVDTVTLSNHPGHGGFRGRVTPAAEIRELVAGLGERGALRHCAAVVSGYLGAADQGPALLEAVAAVKAANPRALYVLDPVMGDHGRIYVQPGIPEFLREHAVARADIATPNQLELELLAGGPVGDTAAALAAARRLQARGPACVVATGLPLSDIPAGQLAVLVVTDRVWRVVAPRIDHPAYGAGDVFTATFLALLLSGSPAPDAAAHAAAALHALVARSAAGGPDLALVAGQDDLRHPPARFRAEPLA